MTTDTRKLTEKQAETLYAIHWRKLYSAHIRGRWRWLSRRDGEEYTAQVQALVARKLLELWYPSGGCEVNLTEAARERQAEWFKP